MKSPHELVRVGNNDIKEGHFNCPEGITEIGVEALRMCLKLTSITLPQGIIAIGNDAFHGCMNLRTIIFKQGLSTIGERAFFHCDNVTTITLPEGITKIATNAFTLCDALKYIIIDSKEDSEVNRIRSLLPEDMQEKVIKKSYFVSWILNATEALNRGKLPSELCAIIKHKIQHAHFTQMLNKQTKKMSLEEVFVCVIKDEYNKVVASDYFTLFKPSHFPTKPTLMRIIAHAFSGGTRTMRALQQLNYIDSAQELTSNAPKIFKRAFRLYKENLTTSSEKTQHIITIEEIDPIKTTIAKYSPLHKLEMFNDYGKAMYLLGLYCSLYSDTSTNFNWTYRSENEMPIMNFFNGNLLNTHTETVKSFLKSHCSGNWICSHEIQVDKANVIALLLGLKDVLLLTSNAFNPNGNLATTINDIQILCNVHCIDVVALSQDIEARKSITNHNGMYRYY